MNEVKSDYKISLFKTSKYLFNASCHVGKRSNPFLSNSTLDILLLFGLLALAANASELTGVTSTSNPACLKISQANSYQLHNPSFVA